MNTHEIAFERDHHAGVQVDGEGESYVPSPEDFLPTPPRAPGPLARVPDTAGLRLAMAFFIMFWALSLHDWQSDRADGLWVSGFKVFHDHEYWRLFSALFDHADMGHLLSNAPLFLIFGWFLYSFFGWLVFPGAAFAIGALSNLLTVYSYHPNAELLGASGMLYGMVALWLVLYVRFETEYAWGARLLRAGGVSLLLLAPTSFVPETSYMAHFTGFVVGLATGLVIAPWIKVRHVEASNASTKVEAEQKVL